MHKIINAKMNNNLAFLKRPLLVGKLYPEPEKIVSMCLFLKYCEFYKNMIIKIIRAEEKCHVNLSYLADELV